MCSARAVHIPANTTAHAIYIQTLKQRTVNMTSGLDLDSLLVSFIVIMGGANGDNLRKRVYFDSRFQFILSG